MTELTHEAPLSVLIIDDDVEVNRSLELVLQTLGFNTATALTGDEGISLIGKNTYDLVLCDLRLPGKSGIDVLKDFAQKVPIILMTAFSNQEIASQAASCGAFDYLRKPIFPDDLMFTLKRFEEH